MVASIRETESKDIPELAKFLARVYRFAAKDYHADPQFLTWKYLDPYAGQASNRSYLLEKNDKIVAHCGVCRVTFRLENSVTVRGVTMMDWAADPSTPGVGVQVFRKLMEMAPVSFVIGGAPPTRAITPRIGFQSVGEAAAYAAWLRPWCEFRTRPLNVRSTLRLLHGLMYPAGNRRPLDAGWEFAPVPRFDDSILPILNGTQRKWSTCERTTASLNHLLECPYPQMHAFLLHCRGELKGYFVLGTADWEARLLDLVVDSADAHDWNFACAAVTQAALLNPNVCRVRALATFPIFSRALIWNGFWCQYKEPIVIYDPTNILHDAFPIGFQLFDGDSGY